MLVRGSFRKMVKGGQKWNVDELQSSLSRLQSKIPRLKTYHSQLRHNGQFIFFYNFSPYAQEEVDKSPITELQSA